MLRENLYYLQSLGQKDMPVENMLAVRQAYEPEKLLDAFLRESERCYYTSLSFPSRVADSSVLQAQRQNYDYFIHTMAKMMKKYAPEILK